MNANTIEPILYMIMRSDIPDMNPGKLGAQAFHIGNDFEMWVRDLESQAGQYGELLSHIEKWREGAKTSGTVICLSATKSEILETVYKTDFSDYFTDPTYPWRNWYGEFFLSEEITGAWFFVCDENPNDLTVLKKFNLHK